MNSPRPGCLAYGLFVALLIWMCGVLGLSAPLAWAVRDIVVIEGGDWPFWASPLLALVQALLIGVPAGLLAAFTPTPHLRAAYLAWTVASALLAALGLARGLPFSLPQLALTLQLLVALLGALGIALGWRRSPAATAAPTPLWLAGLALGALLAAPALAFGALGSLLDTLLALALGLALGLVAALLASRLLVPVLDPARPGASVGFGGLVLGAALLIVAAGAGFEASNLLLIAVLPALGVGAFVLALPAHGTRRAWLAPALLVGLAAAALLALFDSDEITLLLGADVPLLALNAVGIALPLALAVSAALWAAHGLLRRLTLPIALGGLALASAGAGLLYATAGHPGFYGEKLLVVLREQADLGAVPVDEGREARLRFVYTALADHAERTQAGIRGDLERLGVAYTPYYLVNALEVDGGPLVRLWLSTRPEVDRILVSPRLRPLPVPPPPEPGAEEAPARPPWNIRAIDADRVWDEFGITGEGIVIGQSDSGVDLAHPALAASYRGAGGQHTYNWLDPWYGTPAPRDYGFHGTHTLGSALGAGGIGVAPGATWFACSNLARNLGNAARYLDCLQFMLAPHAPGADPFRAGDPLLAAHVLNNSWGCPPIEGCDPASLQPAVDALRAAGIFVVASAGNEGPECASLRAPIAIYDSVLTVGAIDRDGNLASFSSRGPVEVDGSGRPKPDIVAPGADILSAQPGGTYGSTDGTSMAGPHMAGVVALVWSANPDLIGDVARTEQILLDTATPYTGETPLSCAGGPVSNLYGYGVVNAYAAVQAALELR